MMEPALQHCIRRHIAEREARERALAADLQAVKFLLLELCDLLRLMHGLPSSDPGEEEHPRPH